MDGLVKWDECTSENELMAREGANERSGELWKRGRGGKAQCSIREKGEKLQSRDQSCFGTTQGVQTV